MIRMLALLIATLMTTPALAQVDGTYTPTIQEITTQDNVTSYFVMGDGAFGDAFATMASLIQGSPAYNRQIADDLWERRDRNAPVFLMEAARRYADIDPDRALYSYFLGRARSLYDAMRCVDSTAMQAIPLIDEFAGNDIARLMEDPVRLHAQLSAVYSSGEVFTSQVSPWWICSSSDSVFFAAANGQSITRDEWLKQSSEWVSVQNGLNQNLLNNIQVAANAMVAR
jgi:hypothetical protein